MYIGRRFKVRPMGFRHKIRENFTPYYSEDHLLGIDPFDSSKFPSVYEPPTNVKEENEGYEIELMIPGFKKEEVDISVVGDCLVIEGNKESKVQEEDQDYIHHEHVVNGFRREFYLNPMTNKDNIEASFADGVLKIILHKTESSNEEKKSISIQ